MALSEREPARVLALLTTGDRLRIEGISGGHPRVRGRLWRAIAGTAMVLAAASAGLTACTVGPVAPAGPPQSTVSGPTSTEPLIEVVTKKGVGAWTGVPRAAEALDRSGATWYYSWSAAPPPDLDANRRGLQFVPMIWGADDVTDENLEAARQHGPYLLGFNEPDISGQAAMDVEQAIELWPKLEATGLQLGSPAVAADGAQPGGWLDRFMTEANARGYRVDFVAVHFYSSDFDTDADIERLRSYLSAVHERYNKPIWLTEYGLANWEVAEDLPTPLEAARFAAASTQLLEGLPFVERYAWFSLSRWEPIPTIALSDDNGEETVVGEAYRLGEVPTSAD